MQQIGETRQEMTRDLLTKIRGIINDYPNFAEKYYILVHAKPEQSGSHRIRQKILVMKQKPPMLLATLLFGVDRKRGELTLEWALPWDGPQYTVDQKHATPVPEVIESILKVGQSNYVYGE